MIQAKPEGATTVFDRLRHIATNYETSATLLEHFAANGLTPAQIEERLQIACSLENRHSEKHYRAGWMQAADRIARVDSDWLRVDHLERDEDLPNIGDLRDFAEQFLRKQIRLLKAVCLAGESWSEFQRRRLTQAKAHHDCCLLACELLDRETHISSRDAAEVLRQNPSIRLMEAQLRLRDRQAQLRWRAGR